VTWAGAARLMGSWGAAMLLAVLPLAPGSAALLEATVLSWHDGDTLRVVLGGRTQTVRLIGIDAPEVSPNDRARDQARRLGVPLRELLDLGRRSRDFASRLAPPGTRVRLELDVQTTDRYGRLLSYLWLPDGSMVNERILEAGWALLLTVPPSVRHAERLREAQRRARERGVGLWASAGPGREPGTACDPSYPDVCIPPPPPDLDCRDIPWRRFRVLPPDPHGFDRDRDGIGCERCESPYEPADVVRLHDARVELRYAQAFPISHSEGSPCCTARHDEDGFPRALKAWGPGRRRNCKNLTTRPSGQGR
jgi:micrococcal nuclease